MKQFAELKKINIYKPICWIEIMFGNQLSDMAKPGQYGGAKIEPLI
jgi:hypothetical protein